MVKQHKLGKMGKKNKGQLISMIHSHDKFNDIVKDIVVEPKKKRVVSQHILDALAKGRAKRKANLANRKGNKVIKKPIENKVEPVVIKKVDKVIEKVIVKENKPAPLKVSKDIKRKESILKKLGLLDREDKEKMIRKIAMELIKL